MKPITFDGWSLLVLVGLLLTIGRALWVYLPRHYGVSALPARRIWIQRALELARVQPGETVYDLGAGDGRALVIAAREFKAKAVGIEVEPLHCAVAWFRALFSGVVGRVSIRRDNLLYADLSDADVVFIYLNPDLVEKLRPQFELNLQPGTRVVSVSFPFEGWEPADMDIGHLLFLYEMPPQPGSLETFLHANIT